jgi:hypothetical protein
MFYALPFLIILWSIAAIWLAGKLRNAIGAVFDSAPVARQFPWISRRLPGVLVAGVGVFALLTVPAVETAAKMTFGIRIKPPDYWDRYRTNWIAVAPYLRTLVNDAEAVIASQPLHAIWYLGDVDFAINATMLADIAEPGTHAAMDPRTGRLVFDDLATLKNIVACHGSGVVVVHGPALSNESRVAETLSSYLTGELIELALPVRTDMHVFRWDTASRRENCTGTS